MWEETAWLDKTFYCLISHDMTLKYKLQCNIIYNMILDGVNWHYKIWDDKWVIWWMKWHDKRSFEMVHELYCYDKVEEMQWNGVTSCRITSNHVLWFNMIMWYNTMWQHDNMVWRDLLRTDVRCRTIWSNEIRYKRLWLDKKRYHMTWWGMISYWEISHCDEFNMLTPLEGSALWNHRPLTGRELWGKLDVSWEKPAWCYEQKVTEQKLERGGKRERGRRSQRWLSIQR